MAGCIPEAELERLRQKALSSPEGERAFFSALLNARLFAHVPISDDSGRLRFVQFERPDGLTVLPVFTAHARALKAIGPAVRIVELDGRVFLEATRGATLMLDPNDESCTLYPEEVASLLKYGALPAVVTLANGPPLYLSNIAPADVPPWLASTLRIAYAALPVVEAAFLLERVKPAPDGAFLVVIIGVPTMHAQHAMRATASALGGRPDRWAAPIDVATFDPAEGAPDVVGGCLDLAFYRRCAPAT